MGPIMIALALARGQAGEAAPSPDATPATAPVGDGLMGTWRFVGGEVERAGREAAIEECVQALHFLVRGIARDRLIKNSPLATSLSPRRDGTRIRFARHGYETASEPDGQPSAGVSLEGDPVTVRHTLTDTRLVEFIQAREGSRETHLTLDGDRLILRTWIRSPQLPRPITYALTFARATP